MKRAKSERRMFSNLSVFINNEISLRKKYSVLNLPKQYLIPSQISYTPTKQRSKPSWSFLLPPVYSPQRRQQHVRAKTKDVRKLQIALPASYVTFSKPILNNSFDADSPHQQDLNKNPLLKSKLNATKLIRSRRTPTSQCTPSIRKFKVPKKKKQSFFFDKEINEQDEEKAENQSISGWSDDKASVSFL